MTFSRRTLDVDCPCRQCKKTYYHFLIKTLHIQNKLFRLKKTGYISAAKVQVTNTNQQGGSYALKYFFH